MKKLPAVRNVVLSGLIIALSLSLNGCKGQEAEVDEVPTATTDTTTMEEPTTTTSMDTGMGVDMGTDMTTSEPMGTDVTPAEAGQVVASETEIAKHFPDYDAAVTAGKVREVTVFYATDRKSTSDSKSPGAAFGRERADKGQLSWGTCVVSIPKKRKIGSVPGIGVSTRQENPLRHIVLMKLNPLSQDLFVATLRTSVSGARKKELLVFVHGFNVTFENAARRTAQLAVDLEFDGVPVFYSWPAQGELTRAKYQMDQENARLTIPRLEKFLLELVDRSGATAIHLIAHSMGSDALTQALGRIASKRPQSLPIFTDVILTAPDIDRDNFIQLAEEFKGAGKRFTMYASSNDKALHQANRVNRFPRVGDIRAGVVVVSGIETIDVSPVDRSVIGHFYYGANEPVIRDMRTLINEGKMASERRATLEPCRAGE